MCFFLLVVPLSNTDYKCMSAFVIFLPTTDRLQQVDNYVRICSTSINYWPPLTCWSLCQRLIYFYQLLTAFNKLTYYVKTCATSINYWPPLTCRCLCQKLFYFYQLLIAFNMLKLCQRLFYFYEQLTAFNMLKFILEVVLLLSTTDRL